MQGPALSEVVGDSERFGIDIFWQSTRWIAKLLGRDDQRVKNSQYPVDKDWLYVYQQFYSRVGNSALHPYRILRAHTSNWFSRRSFP